jgi:Transposase DDE domain group 1
MGDGERPFFGSGSIPKSDWSFAPGRNVQHRLVPLLRQSVYSRLAGYEDTNNAERLAHDPAMRTITGWWDGDRPATSTNTMSRFGTEMLTAPENLEGLTELNTAAWCTASSKGCLHNPLFLFNQFGTAKGRCSGQAMSIPGRCRPPNRRYTSPGGPGGGLAIRLPTRPQEELPARSNTLYRLKGIPG